MAPYTPQISVKYLVTLEKDMLTGGHIIKYIQKESNYMVQNSVNKILQENLYETCDKVDTNDIN